VYHDPADHHADRDLVVRNAVLAALECPALVKEAAFVRHFDGVAVVARARLVSLVLGGATVVADGGGTLTVIAPRVGADREEQQQNSRAHSHDGLFRHLTENVTVLGTLNPSHSLFDQFDTFDKLKMYGPFGSKRLQLQDT
jgi:hypothetical protein